MHIDKEQVADVLRQRGEYDRAHQLETVLPSEVDTEQDAGLLKRFEVHPKELTDNEADSPSDASYRPV